MRMDQDRLTAQQRAAKISWNLIVVKNVSDEPLWRVQWRDSGGNPKMRAVGKRGQVAKLWPFEVENPFDPDEKKTGRRYDAEARRAWMTNWETTRRGRTPRPDTAISYDEARDLAKAVVLKHEQDIDAERAQQAAGQGEGPITFGQLAEDYVRAREQDMQRGKLKRGSYEKYKSMLRQPPESPKANEALIVRALGDLPVADVTMKDVKAFLQDQIDEGKADSTLGLYRAAISGVLGFAVERELITRNVTFDLPRRLFGGESVEDDVKFYEPDQVEEIARLCTDAQVADMIRLAKATGLRKSELAALKWSSVDTDNGLLHVRATMVSGVGGAVENKPKSGKIRSVPMSDQALLTLMRLKDRETFTEQTDRVFATRTGGHVGASFVSEKWKSARDRWIAAEVEAGRPEPAALTFHSTRHTFGVELARGGVPGLTIQGAMGHSNLKMTQHYLTYAPRRSDAELFTRAQGGIAEKAQQAAEQAVEPVEN